MKDSTSKGKVQPSQQPIKKCGACRFEENVRSLPIQYSQRGMQDLIPDAKQSTHDPRRDRSMSLHSTAPSKTTLAMPLERGPELSTPLHRRSSVPAALIASPREIAENTATAGSLLREDVTSESSEKDDEPPHHNRPATRSVAKTCLLSCLYVIAVAAAAGLLWRRHTASKMQALVDANSSHAPLIIQSETTTVSDAAACDNPKCSRVAALLQATVDVRAPPCTSFYRYSCGTWLDTNSRPLRDVFREAFTAQVAERALKTWVPTKGQNARQKAARFFDACYATVTSSRGNLVSVKRLLAGGIAWPGHHGTFSNLLDAVLYMSTKIRLPVLLEFAVDNSRQNTNIIVQPTTKFLKATAARRRRMNRSQAIRYFRAVYEAFSSDNTSDTADAYRDIHGQEIFIFELLKLSVSDDNRNRNDSVSMDAALIHRRTPLFSAEDWSAVLLKYFNITDDSKADVTVENSRYFDAVFDRHKVVGRAKFTGFYAWLCVQALVPFTNKRIMSLYYAPQLPHLAHRQYCLAETKYFFPGVLEGNLFDEEYERNRLLEVTGAIVRGLGSSKGPFNHGSCSAALREKKSQRFVLADPINFDNLPDMTRNPLINWSRMKSAVPSLLLKVKETLAPNTQQQSTLSDAAFEDLDPSFYSSDIPRGAIYGGLGLKVATALARWFLRTRTGCRRHLEKTLKHLRMCAQRQVMAPSVLNVTTQTVVMTSSMLWLAFHGYKGEELASKFGRLTDDVLFFVVQCLPFCGMPRGDVQCEWPLAHNAEFSRVFGCSSGDRMNPESKCSLYL